jgi:hypothetical protein
VVARLLTGQEAGERQPGPYDPAGAVASTSAAALAAASSCIAVQQGIGRD